MGHTCHSYVPVPTVLLVIRTTVRVPALFTDLIYTTHHAVVTLPSNLHAVLCDHTHTHEITDRHAHIL